MKIDATQDNIYVAMGLTDEQTEVLSSKVKDAITKVRDGIYTSFGEVMKDVLEQCETQEEVAMQTWVLARSVNKINGLIQVVELKNLLKQ